MQMSSVTAQLLLQHAAVCTGCSSCCMCSRAACLVSCLLLSSTASLRIAQDHTYAPLGPRDVFVICASALHASMFFITASSTPLKCLCPSFNMACRPYGIPIAILKRDQKISNRTATYGSSERKRGNSCKLKRDAADRTSRSAAESSMQL